MRQSIINKIICDVSENGDITKYSMTLYVENRISKKAFDEAVKKGLKIFKRRIYKNEF